MATRYAPACRVASSQVTVTDKATIRSFTPVDQRGEGAIRQVAQHRRLTGRGQPDEELRLRGGVPSPSKFGLRGCPHAGRETHRSADRCRSRSHRCCWANVCPPRCAYRIHPSYGSARAASLPPAAGHYESNLFNAKQMVGSDSTRQLISNMFGGASDMAISIDPPPSD